MLGTSRSWKTSLYIYLDRKKWPEHEWALKTRSTHMTFLFKKKKHTTHRPPWFLLVEQWRIIYLCKRVFRFQTHKNSSYFNIKISINPFSTLKHPLIILKVINQNKLNQNDIMSLDLFFLICLKGRTISIDLSSV